jgi:hypothetical protein
MSQIEVTTLVDDSRILSLFREWIEAQRASGRRWLVDDDDDDNDPDLDRATEIERKIHSIPTIGRVGIAVKVYLLIHADDDDFRADRAALPGSDIPDSECFDVSLKRSILKDVTGWVPELDKLAADYIGFVPHQPPPVALLNRQEPRDLDEELRRSRIIDSEERELIKKIWAVRPPTTSDYQDIVRQILARHPDWFKTNPR